MLASYMPPPPRSLRDTAFRAELGAAVAELEATTSAELVVLLAPRSGSYPEAGWMAGVGALLAAFVLVMFHPAEIGDEALFLAPLAAFLLGFVLPLLVPRLRALLASRAAIARNVELVARSSFQKAGLHATREATGLLVYVSLLERAVFLVADRGITRALPENWLVGARQRVTEAVRGRQPTTALLAALRGLARDLEGHLPRRPDDMNELPNAIDVVF
jgi:putative membrane protein